MYVNGDVRVFYILIPIFIIVGIHMLLYSRKRKKMIESFAKKHGLVYVTTDGGALQEKLNERLGIRENGMIRSFSRVADVVSDGNISLFRYIELLDLNPYHRTQVTHTNHIAVTFTVPNERQLFFERHTDGKYVSLYPKDVVLNGNSYFETSKRQLEKNPPRHRITISVNKRQGLIYLNPLVVGSEKCEDIEYLFSFAQTLRKSLIEYHS